MDVGPGFTGDLLVTCWPSVLVYIEVGLPHTTWGFPDRMVLESELLSFGHLPGVRDGSKPLQTLVG